MSLNKMIAIGRLGADPDLKYTPSGDAVCNFSIATTEKWKDKTGQKQERTEWIRCVAWRQQAELIAKYLTKGREVYVEGKLQTRSWDKDGQKQYMTEVNVSNVVFLGSGKGGGQRDEATPDDAGGGGVFAPPTGPMGDCPF